MSVIDRVKTHFETLKTLTIEVEKWKDDNGKPSVFYSEPLTLEEKNIIFKKSNNFQDLTVLVDLIIMSHYNLWLAYLKKEQDQYKRNQSVSEAKNYK